MRDNGILEGKQDEEGSIYLAGYSGDGGLLGDKAYCDFGLVPLFRTGNLFN